MVCAISGPASRGACAAAAPGVRRPSRAHAVGVAERRRSIAVDVNLAEHVALGQDGHDDLGPGFDAAGEISRVRIHIVDNDRRLFGGGGADDVNSDPRYLACSIETRSEIVVPILTKGDVLGEIDIDSDRPGAFGDADRMLLEKVAALLAPRLRKPRAKQAR